VVQMQAERAAAEEAARRFRFLADASSRLAESLDVDSTLSTLIELAVGPIADWAVVYVIEGDGRLRRVKLAHREAALAGVVEAVMAAPLELGETHPIMRVIRSGAPLLVPVVQDADLATLAPDPAGRRLITALGIASFMILPLRARGRQLGAVGLAVSQPTRAFSQDNLFVATTLASRAALAVDNARLFAEVNAANRAMSDLLAVVSHDLRTPLNSIIGYTDLFEVGAAGETGPRAQEWIARIRRAADHQLHLIDQLLLFVRAGEEGAELQVTDVDVAELFEDVRSMVAPLAAKAGLTLSVACEPRTILRSDPDLMRQILVNLVTNAIKYTPVGSVRVAATADAGEVTMTVTDTGSGIAAEDLDRIFEPFWKESRTTDVRSGTGLGLSIVQRLVRRLGGRISVASTPGAGSTFSVTLPSAG
jgi:signal transduction histidine kinase